MQLQAKTPRTCLLAPEALVEKAESQKVPPSVIIHRFTARTNLMGPVGQREVPGEVLQWAHEICPRGGLTNGGRHLAYKLRDAGDKLMSES